MYKVHKMYKKPLVFFCTLWYVGTIPGLLSASSHSTAMKFSISSRRNVTGHWVAEVQLEHNAEHNDKGPWKMVIDHITTKHEDTSESILILANITAPSQQHNPDYELFPGLGYYKFHTNGTNWFDARKSCVQEGAHLAILNSEFEARTLGTIVQRYPKIFDGWRNQWSYIGAHDLNVEGEFVTIFNQPLNQTGYMKWYGTQPDGGNCLVILRGQGTLGDTDCADELSFFCEQEL